MQPAANLITRDQLSPLGAARRVTQHRVVERADSKRMASPLPSPHPDDADAPVRGDGLRLAALHRDAHFTIDTSFDGQPAADLSDVLVEILCESLPRSPCAPGACGL